jgi:RNA recognition motif-containing protein
MTWKPTKLTEIKATIKINDPKTQTSQFCRKVGHIRLNFVLRPIGVFLRMAAVCLAGAEDQRRRRQTKSVFISTLSKLTMKVVIVLGLITFLLNQHPNHALRLFGASSFTTAKGKAAHYLATSAGHSLKSFKHVQSHQKLLQTLSSSSSIRSQSHLFMISEQSHAPTLQDSFEQFEQLAGKPLPPADEPVLVNEATQTHQQPEEASTPITTIPEESATTASTVSANADNGNNNSEIDQDLIVTVDTNVDPTTTATAPLTAVAPVEPPKQTMPQPQVHRELSVFIGLIPRNVTEDVLKQIIATRIGEDIQIVRMAIPTVKTGHVRGSAFVQFVNAEAREQAFQRLQGLVIEGHKMKVDYGERSMDKIGKRDSANRALVQARYQQNQFQSNAAAMGMISSYPYNAPMPMYYPQAYYPPPPAGAYPGPGGYYYPMPPQPMPMMPGYPQPYAPPQSYPQRQYQQQPPPQQYQQQQQPQYQQQPQQPQFQQYPPQDNYQQPGQENMRRMMRNRPPQRRNYYNDEYQYQKPARPQRELSDPKLSIYVANVPFSMTESNLKSLFQETTGIAPDDTTIVANRNGKFYLYRYIHSYCI